MTCACAPPPLERLGRDWYVDAVPPGTPAPHLYWVRNGQRVLVDRHISSVLLAGSCVFYQTTRPGHTHVVYAISPGKAPVAVAESDTFRPWRLSWDGIRRFEMPTTDANGVTSIAMDFVENYEMCLLAYNQPEFRDDWTKTEILDFTRAKTIHAVLDVGGADTVGNSTLSDQVRKRHPEEVGELLRAGADVNAANRSGITPLMTAIAFDAESTKILERLLDAGAMVNARDAGGQTPLMHAAHFGRRAAAEILLARGADPTIRDELGRTAAAMTGNSPAAAELAALLDRAAAKARSRK